MIPSRFQSVRFANRIEAGEALAERLQVFTGVPGVVVLALPRGGVPVGHVVADHLGVPLDVLVVRKLGVPGHEELAFGAIASGGVVVLNSDVVDGWALDRPTISRITARAEKEVARREKAYRNSRPPPDLAGRTVILVDDGIATGATTRAAIASARARGAGRVVVAAPVIAEEAWETVRREADEVHAVALPRDFGAVGRWYVDFRQVSDEEVRELLAAAPGA